MTAPKRYVVGLLFDAENHDKVLLVRKSRPEYQKGKLNGVGGKIEEGETPLAAIVREIEEETDLYTDPDIWKEVLVLRHKDDNWVVHFFRAFITGGLIDSARNADQTEPLVAFNWHRLYDLVPVPHMKNLRWILPLALDTDLVHPIEITDQVPQ